MNTFQSRNYFCAKSPFMFPIILTAIFLSIIPAVTPHPSASVVINEIYPKPSDNESSWIELFNTDETNVSMNQWTIQNSSGETKTFILNASAVMGGHGFYTITKSQSGIKMNVDGDTVILKDDHGSVIDTQSYPGILGFNTSVGRSPDGGAAMTTCTAATQNTANNCPAPTPTSTPMPTPSQPQLPTLTPIPPAESAPTETVSLVTNNPSDESIPRIIKKPTVLGTDIKNPPEPTLAPDMVKIEIPNSLVLSKTTIMQAIIVLVAWSLLAIVAFLNKRRKNIRKKHIHQPPQPVD